MKKGCSAALAGLLVFSSFAVPGDIAYKEAAPPGLQGKNITQTTEDSGKHLKEKKKLKKKFVEDELIVQFEKGADPEKVLKKHNMKRQKKVKNKNIHLVKFNPKKESMSNARKRLSAEEEVHHVQPNYKYYPASFTNDSYSNQLWGLHNSGQTIQGQAGRGDVDINLPEAWGKTENMNLQQTTVAVIDTGTDINHPDLAGKIWTNEEEKNGSPNVDDDGNGYVDDVNGWDFYNGDNTVYDPADGDEHGTHVAGTIAAETNNGEGVTGIAPNVKIMPLKFIGPEGGSTFDAIQAIQYAKSQGVKISNNSWGSYGGYQGDLLSQAIADSGMLFAAAAGNESNNNDEMPSFPASYTNENILSVGAIDNQGRLAGFSNYGKNSVDVAAPGVSILSTVPKKPPVVIPGYGASVEVSNGSYKAIVNGFGFENIKTFTERRDAFAKALAYLGASKTSPILLVDDDESDAGYPSYLSVYRELLTSLGYSYTTRSVSQTANGPDANTLKQYKTVIWFTGQGFGPSTAYALTANDRYALESYLNSGGKLLLSGRDAIWGSENSNLVKNKLGIQWLGESNAENVTGRAGTAYGTTSYQVNPIDYADFYSVNNPAIAKVNLAYPEKVAYYNEYEYFDGTSMATPHVSGVAALMMGANPNLTPAQAISRLKATGKPMTSGADQISTGSFIDASRALE
ncbi:MAG TPA: S8 family serine peptidase [Chondromyces sp.]|nr:S8 family serine peptidase [Chondromyces sp.]